MHDVMGSTFQVRVTDPMLSTILLVSSCYWRVRTRWGWAWKGGVGYRVGCGRGYYQAMQACSQRHPLFLVDM
jgi:hypothetical protein